MIISTRLRSFLGYTALYVAATGAIAYFGMNAFSGNRGIEARNQYDLQTRELTAQLDTLRTEREELQRRVSLMQTGALDPDVLEEKARQMLGEVSPDDVVVLLPGASVTPAK